jgi:hypothetical protein
MRQKRTLITAGSEQNQVFMCAHSASLKTATIPPSLSQCLRPPSAFPDCARAWRQESGEQSNNDHRHHRQCHVREWRSGDLGKARESQLDLDVSGLR